MTSLFIQADKQFPMHDLPNEFHNAFRTFRKIETLTDHPCYKKYHHLLSYKFKTHETQHVFTGYLDDTYRKFHNFPGSTSESVVNWWYVYEMVVNRFYNSLMYKIRHNPIPVYKRFYWQAHSIIVHYKRTPHTDSTSRRFDIDAHFHKIFELFNDFLKKYEYFDPTIPKYVQNTHPTRLIQKVYPSTRYSGNPVYYYEPVYDYHPVYYDPDLYPNE